MGDADFVHPYIPNSVPEVKREMLREVGARDAQELYAEMIPDRILLKRPLNLPYPLPSELDLRRHVEGILEKNGTCADHLSFLGAGCWQHYVPAVCLEIVGRSEFLTAYAATKSAVQGFTVALALETAQSGVNVNCVMPGYIESRSAWGLRGSLGEGDADEAMREFGLKNPWGARGPLWRWGSWFSSSPRTSPATSRGPAWSSTVETLSRRSSSAPTLRSENSLGAHCALTL